MPTLYLADLRRRAGAFKLDAYSNGDDTWTLIYTFVGGRQKRSTTARCRLVVEH